LIQRGRFSCRVPQWLFLVQEALASFRATKVGVFRPKPSAPPACTTQSRPPSRPASEGPRGFRRFALYFGGAPLFAEGFLCDRSRSCVAGAESWLYGRPSPGAAGCPQHGGQGTTSVPGPEWQMQIGGRGSLGCGAGGFGDDQLRSRVAPERALLEAAGQAQGWARSPCFEPGDERWSFREAAMSRGARLGGRVRTRASPCQPGRRAHAQAEFWGRTPLVRADQAFWPKLVETRSSPRSANWPEMVGSRPSVGAVLSNDACEKRWARRLVH